MERFRMSGLWLMIIGGCLLFFAVKAGNYNTYFGILGVLFLGGGYFLYQRLTKKVEEKTESEYSTWKNKLKESGIKIEVDLNAVEIKASSYREENTSVYQNSKYAALDELSGEDRREYTQISQTVLTYTTEVIGKMRTFISPAIAKNEDSVVFLLANQKKTFLYVDPFDIENYFFDLEFLE